MSHLAALNYPARGGTLAAITDQDQLRQWQLELLNEQFEPLGWHSFASDAGRIWAVHVPGPKSLKMSCGETVDADTPADMRDVLTKRLAP